MTITILKELLHGDLIKAGMPNAAEEFEQWRDDPDELIKRIDKEWAQLGREPDLGDIVWFTTTKRAKLSLLNRHDKSLVQREANVKVREIPTGSSRANVCNDFAVSPEFQALAATLYGTAQSDNERTENFVNNFYLGAYGRNATATELQQQREALNAAAAQGQTQVQAQAEVMGRAMFAGQINERLSDTQFVTNLYESFLQRGPDAEGLSYWTQASVGQGRQNVLNSFATCGPFREWRARSIAKRTGW